MNRPKRGPKVRGCYECSQRRINCDRNEPVCTKCLSKGITCSGQGIRYRFHTDVVQSKRINDGQEQQGPRRYTPSIHTGYQSMYAMLESSPPAPRSSTDTDLVLPNTNYGPDVVNSGGEVSLWRGQSRNDGLDTDCTVNTSSDDTEPDLLRHLPEEFESLVSTDFTPLLPSVPDRSTSMTRFLFSYFSTHIAPEMVAVDDVRNGWRHLALPIAHDDPLVKSCVLSAAAYHFTGNVSDRVFDPTIIYHEAISRLRQRQNVLSYPVRSQQIVILSLLLLLTTTMVSGSSDFRTILALLDGAWSAVGGEANLGTGELGVFITRQFWKYYGFAAPLLSRVEGLQVISHTAASTPHNSRGWDDYASYLPLYSEHDVPLSYAYLLTEQACSIYKARVEAGSQLPPMTNAVERLKTMFESFPHDNSVFHVLPWTIFIAAAESSTYEQRQYFIDLLIKQHARNGFANILHAVQFLQSMQMPKAQSDWTQYLPNLSFFVV